MMFRTEPERRDILHPLRGLADVSLSEKHVWSLLLHKVIMSLENFGKAFQILHFCIAIMACKGLKDSKPNLLNQYAGHLEST